MNRKHIVWIVLAVAVAACLLLQATGTRVLVWQHFSKGGTRPPAPDQPGRVNLSRIGTQLDYYECFYFTGRSVKKEPMLDSRQALGVGVDECPLLFKPAR